MLDAFIIDELKRRELEKRERERPTVDLPPLPEERAPQDTGGGSEQDKSTRRGVVVLDI